jgi:hypothetical protein
MSPENLARMMVPQSVSGQGPGCDATRVVPVGGELASLLLHPSVTPVERIYRRLPSDGIYIATQSRPFTFEMGAIRVPPQMVLAVAEYKFDVFRFYGGSPWDMVPLETRRLPLSLGYDLNFDQYHKGDIKVEILPVPPSTQQDAFNPLPTGGTVTSGNAINPLDLMGQSTPNAIPAVATVYDTTFASGPNAGELSKTSVDTVGAGNALMTQSQEAAQGPSRFPFTFYARENQAVQLRIAVFGVIPIPIAFFEARLAGYLLPMNMLDTMLNAVAPCHTMPGMR